MKKARHFAFPTPLFGTLDKPKSLGYQQRSVYYWWWQYLRRNDDYLAAVKSGGQGPSTSVVRDFGDVTKGDFRSWWRSKGVDLFAEPEREETVSVLSTTDPMPNRANPNLLIVLVPTDLPKSFITKRFAALLKKHHNGRPGVRHNLKSRARYPVYGQPNVRALETDLMVYDLRRANRKMPLWQIAIDLRLSRKHKLRASDTPSVQRDKKNVLAATASRHMRRAKETIKNAGAGVFPKHRG